MKTHYSEADLLETYYLQPGESMPVMLHLADCSQCAGRYERLERKLREAASCSTHEQPETFWARQRMSVMRGVASSSRYASALRIARIAAAAAFTFFLGGAVVYKSLEPALVSPIASSQTLVNPQPAAEEQTAVHDAWQSEELQDFHGVVDWETWQ